MGVIISKRDGSVQIFMTVYKTYHGGPGRYEHFTLRWDGAVHIFLLPVPWVRIRFDDGK